MAFDCVVHQCMKICVEPFQWKTYIPLWIEIVSVYTLNVSVGHGSHIKVDIMQIKHNLIQYLYIIFIYIYIIYIMTVLQIAL